MRILEHLCKPIQEEFFKKWVFLSEGDYVLAINFNR